MTKNTAVSSWSASSSKLSAQFVHPILHLFHGGGEGSKISCPDWLERWEIILSRNGTTFHGGGGEEERKMSSVLCKRARPTEKKSFHQMQQQQQQHWQQPAATATAAMATPSSRSSFKFRSHAQFPAKRQGGKGKEKRNKIWDENTRSRFWNLAAIRENVFPALLLWGVRSQQHKVVKV